MKHKIVFFGEEPVEITDAGPWQDTRLAAIEHELQIIENDIPQWSAEALAALQLGDPYRGGGVLKLAELLRKKSGLIRLRSIHQNAVVKG